MKYLNFNLKNKIMDELDKENENLFNIDIDNIATILTEIKKEIKIEKEEYEKMKKDLDSILEYININEGIITKEQKNDIEHFNQFLKEKEDMINLKQNIYEKYSNMKKLVTINHEILKNKQINFKIPDNKSIETLNFADIIDFDNMDTNEREIFKMVYEKEFNKPFVEILNNLVNKKEKKKILNGLMMKNKNKKKNKKKNKNK